MPIYLPAAWALFFYGKTKELNLPTLSGLRVYLFFLMVRSHVGLKVSSPIGKELDSLADMVSFGVFARIGHVSNDLPYRFRKLGLFRITVVVFSALRLAKFNIDERQTDAFIGVPTPANALFITGLPFLTPFFPDLLNHTLLLVLVSLVFSYLLVAPFELFSLKFKNFYWKGNQIRFAIVITAISMVAWLGAAGLVPTILIYILLSLTGSLMATSSRPQ